MDEIWFLVRQTWLQTFAFVEWYFFSLVPIIVFAVLFALVKSYLLSRCGLEYGWKNCWLISAPGLKM